MHPSIAFHQAVSWVHSNITAALQTCGFDKTMILTLICVDMTRIFGSLRFLKFSY